ncbi:zinc dependent phospholipase C family protein [Christensenellaceae bacterium OttesenSCG-928-M15]|nr:zinc dependent phospholipase C family protein [Christensenellaceae bacterium OttesenSCG-928-M15]
MFTRSHLKLANHICEQDEFEALRRYKPFFAFGNIVPDINILTYFRGHNAPRRLPYVKKQLRRMLEKGKLTAWSAYRLGVMMHYLADSFTLAHNERFEGDMAEHLKYEKELMPLFDEALQTKAQAQKRPEGVEEYIGRTHEEYLLEAQSAQADIDYILDAVFDVTHMVVYGMDCESVRVAPRLRQPQRVKPVNP